MASLRIQRVSKSFGSLQAVSAVDIDIRSGEFFAILGPSGCGKTTLLRLVAGFEQADTGDILLEGKDVTRMSPQSRGVGMVFQNYALFPHMTVYENVAFGLKAKRLAKDEVQARVERVLEAVHMKERTHTHVSGLSGGEQQRVAVARAVVVEPRVLLFDEPLSNLDVALRSSTRQEIKTLQHNLGITTLYVTHDQSEALSLSDRIAVMNRGCIEQVGTPEELYDRPRSPFVAEFLGAANVLHGRFDGERQIFRSGNLELDIPGRLGRDACALAIKPEHITPAVSDGGDTLDGIVASVEYQGFTTSISLSLRGTLLRALFLTSLLTHKPTPGEKLAIRIDWSRCAFFEHETSRPNF